MNPPLANAAGFNRPVTDPLEQSVQYLKGVGPARYEKLQPARNRNSRRSALSLSPHVRGSDRRSARIGLKRRIISDGPGRGRGDRGPGVGRRPDGRQRRPRGRPDCLEGVWFNQPYAARRFRFGQRVAFSGKPKKYRDHWQMANPRVQRLGRGTFRPMRPASCRSTR